MAWRPYPLHDPPQLSRLIVGGLPKLGAQLVMLHRVGTYQDELWLAGGLGVDGIELRPGLTDEDQFATSSHTIQSISPVGSWTVSAMLRLVNAMRVLLGKGIADGPSSVRRIGANV